MEPKRKFRERTHTLTRFQQNNFPTRFKCCFPLRQKQREEIKIVVGFDTVGGDSIRFCYMKSVARLFYRDMKGRRWWSCMMPFQRIVHNVAERCEGSISSSREIWRVDVYNASLST